MWSEVRTWLTWYRKPEYRDIKEYAAEVRTRAPSPAGPGNAIPAHLSLERILENKTCSPMSLYDFYMYLRHIEFSEENLEFYIWYKNYQATWTETLADDPESHYGTDLEAGHTTEEDLLGRIKQLIATGGMCAIGPRSRTLGEQTKALVGFGGSSTTQCGACVDAPSRQVSSKTSHSGTTWQRAELAAVVDTFLMPGANKELNLPQILRNAALTGLSQSADPRHLAAVADHVHGLLRNCSHRNFVRLGVGNGTFETLCMATGLGVVLLTAGFLLVLLRAFVPFIAANPRWDVFAAWPLWWLGSALIVAGTRGSCFFLLLFSRRQRLPWERLNDEDPALTKSRGVFRLLSRLMIFDRKIRVKDVHLRALQRRIVVQSLISGVLFASLGVLFFIFLPIWSDTRR